MTVNGIPEGIHTIVDLLDNGTTAHEVWEGGGKFPGLKGVLNTRKKRQKFNRAVSGTVDRFGQKLAGIALAKKALEMGGQAVS